MEIDRRIFLAGAPGVAPQRRADALSSALVGAWSLIDAVTVQPSGDEIPWTPSRVHQGGLLTFTSTGFISFQVAALPAYVPSPGEAAGFADRWFSYFGRYAVDEARRELKVEILSSYVLSELTSSRPRRLELTGNVLTMTKPPAPTGEGRNNRFRWRRV